MARTAQILVVLSLLGAACGGRPSSGASGDGGAAQPDSGEGNELPPPDDGGVRLPDAGPVIVDGGAGAADGGGMSDAGSGGRDGGAADAGACVTAMGSPDGGVNPGWIGGPCVSNGDCRYDAGVCLPESAGHPGGTCSLRCTRLCPDRAGVEYTTNFCVDGAGPLAGGGMCIARCDYQKLPGGCRTGYTCREMTRYNEASTHASACVPGAAPDAGAVSLACLADVASRCLNTATGQNPMSHPECCPNLTCNVVDALWMRSPIRGITYRYITASTPAAMFMACRLAVAIDRMSAILRELDIVEVVHYGTYNCRTIAGTTTLSQHGLGLAIDLAEFRRRDGETFNVERDWEGDISLSATRCRFPFTPSSVKAKWLYDFIYRLCDDRIFNLMLTPNYNEVHKNHFHIDLTDGSWFLGRPLTRPYLGPGNGD